MATRALASSEWQAYFDRLSRALRSAPARIEVAGLDLGDQYEAEWAALEGLSYDPKDRVFSVFLPGLEHNIREPKQVFVDEGPDGLHSVEIVDADGRRHLVRLEQLLRLPAA
ncbi:MAG: hypothetical protein D6727_02470 [Gammaproteobacteria bacterium]|nr:MAG: hypothetical protein D6727_02470 [Gammaproteobacteria bacterium]